jgi:heme-degrading monooxygenase HmoA
MESNVVVTEPGVMWLFRFRPVPVAFDVTLRETLVPTLLGLPGLLDLYVGRQGPDEHGQRLIATVWATGDAVATVLGDAPERSRLLSDHLSATAEPELDCLPLGFGYRFDRPERPGLLRLVHGEVSAGGLERYVEQANAGTLADAAEGHGPLALYLARRSPDRFVTLSVWSDWATLQEATGGNVDQPIATRHARMLTDWRAGHYEAIPELWASSRTIEIAPRSPEGAQA